jgi:hypothetical protein
MSDAALSPSLGERFEAFCGEAQAELSDGIARVRTLLAAADAELERLRELGIDIRSELPLGASVRLSEMRFIAGFSKRLQS